MKGVFANPFSMTGPLFVKHLFHEGDASDPYVGDDGDLYRTFDCECGSTFTILDEEFSMTAMTRPRPHTWSFVVDVETATISEAVEVMRHRINHDEDYGFEYYIQWDATPLSQTYSP